MVSTNRFYAVDAGPHSGLFDLDWSALFDLLHGVRVSPGPQRLVYPVRTYDGAKAHVRGARAYPVIVERHPVAAPGIHATHGSGRVDRHVAGGQQAPEPSSATVARETAARNLTCGAPSGSRRHTPTPKR